MGAPGYQRRTDDGVIGTSGRALRVFGLNIVSGGAGGIVALKNGAVIGATTTISETGTAGGGRYIDFGPEGVLFDGGCYADIDANTTAITVVYQAL